MMGFVPFQKEAEAPPAIGRHSKMSSYELGRTPSSDTRSAAPTTQTPSPQHGGKSALFKLRGTHVLLEQPID